MITLFLTFKKNYVTIRGIFYSFCMTLFAFFLVLIYNLDNFIIRGHTIYGKLVFGYGSIYLPELGLNINIDCLSYLFMLLVVSIGFCTNIYILNYFKYEAEETTFTLLINWFVLSMLLLVAANNWFTLFLGWELIGLTSFFLINFWTERRGTLKSSFKAFVFNKVSDFFLFGFLILIWLETDISSIKLFNFILARGELLVNFNLKIAAIFLICCASIKSAQLFGHLWLPDSMEAPVPASALIHSATLVSAGLYLLLRFNYFLTLVDYNWIIILIGSITAAYGGVVAASQTDMKKLLAYSTISHCGFLFVCAGLQNYYLVVIYLFMHGIFKAMTFYCVGSFIRVTGTQDTRNMGVVSRYLPTDTIYLIISSANLGGLPLTFGYLYKNFFLLNLVTSNVNLLVVGLCYIGMLTSVVYVYRLVYYSAFDYNKGNINLTIKSLQDNPNADINYWSLSTIAQSLCITIMLSFSIYIYIIFLNYSLFSGLQIDATPIMLNSNINLTKDAHTLYSTYINFFYILYILVIAVICILENRRTYTWSKKMHFLLYLNVLTFFFVVLF